ncbi:uncharacterized protein [Procambarus clarkii]|uniref:uncharacterized protein n=1 Tax=Procambarus clarkii TaxID=6728 RepID=UPI0037438540
MQVRRVSMCVTVVVVSDDLAFLTTFAQWSLKGRLLVSSTRLLVLTDVSLLNHPTLSGIYSKMNAMMLVVKNLNELQECSVYMQQPYSPQGAQALKVASWTPRRGLTLTSSLQLFPDKFSRLSNGPHLVVASETYPTHEPVMVDDPKTPGRKVLRFFSALAKVLQLLADTTNFTPSSQGQSLFLDRTVRPLVPNELLREEGHGALNSIILLRQYSSSPYITGIYK